ncbi:MAG: hypothetical protein HQ582_32270, partial [Planctomycetes bacterium]|nr:hypothetical protein [Planctomycetota bacterium]
MGGHRWTANRRGGSGGWVVAAVVLLSVAVAIDRVPPGFGQDRAGRGQIGSLGQTALFGPAPTVNGIPPQSLGYTSAYQEKARCRKGNSAPDGKPNLSG